MIVGIKIKIKASIVQAKQNIKKNKKIKKKLKLKFEYIERVCLVDWNSPPIYDDYPEDFS